MSNRSTWILCPHHRSRTVARIEVTTDGPEYVVTMPLLSEARTALLDLLKSASGPRLSEYEEQLRFPLVDETADLFEQHGWTMTAFCLECDSELEFGIGWLRHVARGKQRSVVGVVLTSP